MRLAEQVGGLKALSWRKVKGPDKKQGMIARKAGVFWRVRLYPRQSMQQGGREWKVESRGFFYLIELSSGVVEIFSGVSG